MLWPPMRAKLRDRTDETDLLVEMADEHSVRRAPNSMSSNLVSFGRMTPKSPRASRPCLCPVTGARMLWE
jgi:hypothetical protein